MQSSKLTLIIASCASGELTCMLYKHYAGVNLILIKTLAKACQQNKEGVIYPRYLDDIRAKSFAGAKPSCRRIVQTAIKHKCLSYALSDFRIICFECWVLHSLMK